MEPWQQAQFEAAQERRAERIGKKIKAKLVHLELAKKQKEHANRAKRTAGIEIGI